MGVGHSCSESQEKIVKERFFFHFLSDLKKGRELATNPIMH